jgi:heterodisulfide reductase subunit A
MASVGRHENITLLSYSEVESVSGYVGNFSVRVRRKARYVNEETCTGCGTCVEKCPWKKVPSDFDLGLGTRPAIYFQFGQAVPRVPVIDRENCAYFQKGKCRACEKFCQTGSIDFSQQDSFVDLEVGTIILATGFSDFDPRRAHGLGYGALDDVLTGMEFERLVNSGGPTSGQVRLKDGRVPERIALLHCVGSRAKPGEADGAGHEYCSRVCCMYSLKLAHLMRDAVGAEVVEFYRDMRAFGKDYEAFYERVKRDGVQFIRYEGEPSVTRENGHLTVRARDPYTGRAVEAQVDMVVLSTGMEPQPDQAAVGRVFGVSRSSDGFFLEKHPKLAPIETATDGVFLAGACQGPKDIPDSVAQGSAAAAAALSMMDHGFVDLEPFTSVINETMCGGCRTCEALCPYHAIEMVDVGGRTVARVNEVLCKGCGACAAGCPAGAAEQRGFTLDEIYAELEGALAPTGIIRQEAW